MSFRRHLRNETRAQLRAHIARIEINPEPTYELKWMLAALRAEFARRGLAS